MDEPDRGREAAPLTVGVIGLGYVGSCLAASIADRGLDVVGVDLDARLVDELTAGHCRFKEDALRVLLLRSLASGRLRVTTEYADLARAQVVLIAVGTPVRPDGSLAGDQLRGACQALAEHLRPGQLVLVKSTVPPGTTRNVVRPLLQAGGLTAGTDFRLAFTPERLAEGNALADLAHLPMVVGGIDEGSTDAAKRFWQRALGVPVITLDCPEAAEIAKLADNWWIDLNIAMANELARYCTLFEVDVLDVITAANSLPKGNGNVNILLPSVGVGGSCLTKDPWMVRESARRGGLELHTPVVGREVNAAMPGYTARLILDELAGAGRNPSGARVTVLGLAFKNNTGDLRATPVQGVVAALVDAGVEVRLHDPLVDPTQAKEQLGIQPTADLHEAVRQADCVAVLAAHREFQDIDFTALPLADGCVILDGRAYYPKERVAALRRNGLRYRGIGR